MNIHVSKAKARHFLLKKQLLFPPQALSGNAAVEQVFQTLRLIQYDPLNPCGRNQDLVLQARISDYHPDQYYQWLYDERKGIECYDKELCILPIEDFYLATLRQNRVTEHERMGTFLKEYERDLEQLMQDIEQKGPLSSSDIQDARRAHSGWTPDSRFGRVALETLWRAGRVVITRRVNGKKYYDLPHKVYLNGAHTTTTYKQIEKEHILRRLQTVGILPLSGTGGGWQGIGSGKAVSEIIHSLIKKGELVPVIVEGVKKQYVIAAKDCALITQSPKELSSSKLVFIAPLDNLMWDRQMIQDFFDFEYRWEVYTPQRNRTYGYYVLPMLLGDSFIGRIEPVLRKDKTLEIRGLWKETAWNKKITSAYEKALRQFQAYLNAENVVHFP